MEMNTLKKLKFAKRMMLHINAVNSYEIFDSIVVHEEEEELSFNCANSSLQYVVYICNISNMLYHPTVEGTKIKHLILP